MTLHSPHHPPHTRGTARRGRPCLLAARSRAKAILSFLGLPFTTLWQAACGAAALPFRIARFTRSDEFHGRFNPDRHPDRNKLTDLPEHTTRLLRSDSNARR
jgi:hypothetical protein